MKNKYKNKIEIFFVYYYIYKLIIMTDASILKDGVLNFFFKEEGKCLSNFWKGRILISHENEEREYDCGESCFHGEKFTRLGRLCKDETRKISLLNMVRCF